MRPLEDGPHSSFTCIQATADLDILWARFHSPVTPIVNASPQILQISNNNLHIVRTGFNHWYYKCVCDSSSNAGLFAKSKGISQIPPKVKTPEKQSPDSAGSRACDDKTTRIGVAVVPKRRSDSDGIRLLRFVTSQILSTPMGNPEALGNLRDHLCHTQKPKQRFENDIGGVHASERKIR